MEWIDCSKQLPEEGAIVIIKNNRAWSIAFLDEGEWQFEFLTLTDPVTHWMSPKL